MCDPTNPAPPVTMQVLIGGEDTYARVQRRMTAGG
jgi:hypothetical protein